MMVDGVARADGTSPRLCRNVVATLSQSSAAAVFAGGDLSHSRTLSSWQRFPISRAGDEATERGRRINLTKELLMFAPKRIAVAATLLMLSTGMAAAAPAFVLGDLNLRAGPSTGNRVVAVLPRGATVDAFDCGSGWCRVDYDGYSGFASMSYLDVGEPDDAPPPSPLAFLAPIFDPFY
jgi:hypothetical protein